LTQNTERRGALVSRVTNDIDQISTFMQWGGLMIIMAFGQLLIATVLMFVYSWQLTLLVWACFVPLMIALPRFQRWLSAAYTRVRERTGDMLAAVSESVVGAAVIRAYATERRTAERIDRAVDANKAAQVRAQTIVGFVFPLTEIVAAVAIAGIVLLGVRLGLSGDITAGELVAFLFLITLFVAPMQAAAEGLDGAPTRTARLAPVLGGTRPPAAL